MGDGTGTLKFDFDRNYNKIITLDLSSISNTNYALYGNLELIGYKYSDTLIGIFGGKGISGNVTLDGAGTTKLTLESGANIDGTLTIKDGTNTIVVKGDSTQTRFKKGIATNTENRSNTRILFDALNSTDRFVLKDTLTLTQGSIVYGFTDDITNNRIFEVNQSIITLNGGSLGFEGARQVLIGRAGADTLTLQNGSFSILVDPSIASSSPSTPILKGSLTLNGATAFFGLKNPKSGINPFKNPEARNLDGLPTYYVDGNINITDGGLSAFWNDSYGFTVKLKATKLTFSGGFVEGSNVWFEKGSFSASNMISKIDLKNGCGHLIFEDKMTINGGISIRDGVGKTSQIFFRDNAIINKDSGQNYAILARDGGMSPTLEVYFAGEKNIVQGVSAQGSNVVSDGVTAHKYIKVVFEKTSALNTIDGDIKASRYNGYNHKGIVNLDFNGANNIINGQVIADGGVNNLTFEGDGEISGNITQSNNGTNNLILGGNQATLTLKGASNTISTLTATSGNNTLNLESTGTTTSTTSGAINGRNLDIVFSGTSATLTLKGTTNTIKNIAANATTSTLALDASANAVTATIDSINGNLGITMNGSSNKIATLNLNGGIIKSITSSGDTDYNIINFKSGTTTIESFSGNNKSLSLNLEGGNLSLANITADGSTSGSAKLISVDISVGKNSSLLLNRDNKIDSLSGNGGIIDFVGSSSKESSRALSARKTLTTNTFSGNLNAVVFVSKDKADQIIVTDASSNGTLAISAQGDINEILSITQDNDVVVAKVGKGSGVKVRGGESVIDGVVLDLVVEEKKDNSNPQAGTGDYLVGKTITKGVDRSIQTEVNTALAINYDLFLANFNSLNKRMGELRDNPHSQGVWARVFGGAMSSDFGSGSKTEYVTAQAGYDYSLTLENANNYMGIAIAYGKSWTKANEGVGLTTSSLSNIDSNMIEVGIYNSYVMDSGWYNDMIFKFDYIMSDFTLNAGSNTAENSTNNFAMVLSDEFGYRYKFAESEKGNWYIDPQVEVAFGYFNQSDFNHVLNTQSNIIMKATQDNILNLRTRAGMSLGRKFNTAKGFATLYVGVFYEYDYIEGGNSGITLSGGISGNQLADIESNGRAIVNVGSNIELTDGVRIYIDVEKSFGDKQRTDMQFNFGARYSFGEKTPTLSYLEAQKKRVAPLKVEEK